MFHVRLMIYAVLDNNKFKSIVHYVMPLHLCEYVAYLL